MSDLRIRAVACFIGLALLVGGAMQLRADPILEVIDIRPTLARHDIGNALGLAFNPDSNVLYLAHGSDPRGGFIYTWMFMAVFSTSWISKAPTDPELSPSP
jgi:hypothetical protein